MHHFAVVADPAGISPMMRAALRDRFGGLLPFDPEEQLYWESSTRRVAVASSSRDELPGSTLRSARGDVVLRAGLPFERRDGTSRVVHADALMPGGEVGGPDAVHARMADLEGVYALVALAADGHGIVVSDPFGLHPLHWASVGGTTIVSNRPRVVAEITRALTGSSPRVDEEAAAWVVLNGQFFGERTGYRDVSLLPFGEAIVVGADGSVCSRHWHESAAAISSGERSVADDWIETAVQRMTDVVRGAADLDRTGGLSIELTGGRDSRMNLELAVLAGVAEHASFHTFGAPSTNDFRQAAALADALELDHRRRLWPIRPGGPSLEAFTEQVRETAGQSSCWELHTPTLTSGISISGLTGESLRTNYPKRIGATDAAQARRRFERMPFGRQSFVRADAQTVLRRRALEVFSEPLDRGARAEDLFDIFYVRHRLRRWIGDRPDRFHRYVFPLYSPWATAQAMAAGWREREAARLHEHLRTVAALPVADLEFVKGQGWQARPTWSSSTTPARVPTEPSPWTSTLPTREEMLRARVDAIRAAVEHDDANPAFEVVDRELVLGAAARYEELDRRDRIELHSALTLVLWLGLAHPGRADAVLSGPSAGTRQG